MMSLQDFRGGTSATWLPCKVCIQLNVVASQSLQTSPCRISLIWLSECLSIMGISAMCSTMVLCSATSLSKSAAVWLKQYKTVESGLRQDSALF